MSPSREAHIPNPGRGPGSTSRRRIGLLLAFSLIVAAGCAQTSSTALPTLPEWLKEDRRTIGVVAFGSSPEPTLSTLEPENAAARKGAAKGAKKGFAAAGDVISAGSGCSGLGCGAVLLLDTAALVTFPIIGSVYGAATAEREVVKVQPLAEVEGTEALFRMALRDLNIEDRIVDRVIQVGRQKTNHVFLAVAGEEVSDRSSITELSDAILTARVTSLGLWADEGDDPRVGLRVIAAASLETAEASGVRSGRVKYEGERGKLSDWAADDARLFREELDRAIQSLAEQIVEETLLARIANEPPGPPD